ncbi:CoA transferase [Micromonospora sp. WMMD975]|uniref:CaiB/BaiF CoA transferase family protein n=1 Tax=Micromonospora sp. WMMD975 TaxID=3016087 RepID=UPI00249C2B9F|nr:CoA transferase [Micromonospora sp. WMMD975]WFE36445.1 CoA transferase [Micromonospora sp. WMMD975]
MTERTERSEGREGMPGALAGIRVVELGHAIAGPHCAQMLADHGADVVKVEPPAGEMSRNALPVVDGGSIYFASHNRGKRSVCLDLKTEAGREALLRLCDTADVVLTNYGAGVPQRLGWSYDVLRARNPRLVMVHVTGFGAGAADAPRGAYDGVIQAMGGIADLTGQPGGEPTFVGAFVADHVAAYHATIAVLMALRERDVTGVGAYADVSMLDSYTAMLAHEVGLAAAGVPRGRWGNQVQTAFANVFPARDGQVFLAPLGDAAWRRFWAVLGGTEVSYDESTGPVRHRLERVVSEWTSARTVAEVLAAMHAAGVAAGPLRSVGEAVAAMADTDMVLTVDDPAGRPVRVPGRPVRVGLTDRPGALAVPRTGEHTGEILAELGISPHQRPSLADAGPAGPAARSREARR